jgi:MFS family permease
MALGGMGSGFITVAAIQYWSIPNSTVGIYTGALLVGQTVGTLVLGFLADRFGHKLSLVIGALSTTTAFILALLSPGPAWYCAVFALQGIYQGAIFASGILIVMEFGQPERRPTYIGLANTGIGIIGGIAPLLGAGLATLGYSWLFALSAVVNSLSTILMCCWVQEPRHVSIALTSRS